MGIEICFGVTHSLLTRSTHLKRYIRYNIYTHEVYPPLRQNLLVLSITSPQSLKHLFTYRSNDNYLTPCLKSRWDLSLEATFCTPYLILRRVFNLHLSYKALGNSEVDTKHFISLTKSVHTKIPLFIL